ncbi:hypothetical protein VTI28DRAFT_5089 [Corynascus sepedonium]
MPPTWEQRTADSTSSGRKNQIFGPRRIYHFWRPQPDRSAALGQARRRCSIKIHICSCVIRRWPLTELRWLSEMSSIAYQGLLSVLIRILTSHRWWLLDLPTAFQACLIGWPHGVCGSSFVNFFDTKVYIIYGFVGGLITGRFSSESPKNPKLYPRSRRPFSPAVDFVGKHTDYGRFVGPQQRHRRWTHKTERNRQRRQILVARFTLYIPFDVSVNGLGRRSSSNVQIGEALAFLHFVAHAAAKKKKKKKERDREREEQRKTTVGGEHERGV